jgi:cytidine deaminase
MACLFVLKGLLAAIVFFPKKKIKLRQFVLSASILSINMVRLKDTCYPCGACLQFISEFAEEGCLILLKDSKHGSILKIDFKNIFPMQFNLNQK